MKTALKSSFVFLFAVMAAASGCLIGTDDDTKKKTLNLGTEALSNYTVTVNTDSGWSTGTYSIILEDGTVYEDLIAFSTSDIIVKPYGGSVFILGRYLADWVTRVDLSDMKNVVYQYDVAGLDSSANPYDLDFAGVHTAYLIRYDTSSIWIVDPAPADETGFKKGEIDISGFNTGANVPNAIQGMIVGNMYYVLLERNNNGAYDTTSQLLKYDITDPDNPTLLGNVVLDSTGAYNMVLSGDNIYVASWGITYKSWTVPVTERNPNGGIEKVDLPSFATNGVVVDDGTDGDGNAYGYGGFFNDFVVVSAAKGYILIANWETYTYKICEFNPTAGTVLNDQDGIPGNSDDPILEGMSLSDIQLSADRTEVYASVQDGFTPANSGIYTIDITDNSVTGPVSVGLDPMMFEINN